MHRQLLSVLFIVITLASLTLSFDFSLRDYETRNRGGINVWNYNFAREDDSTYGASSGLDQNGPNIITFYDNDNCSEGIGQFRFKCLPDGHGQFDLDIPLRFTVEVQQRLKLRDVWIWIGAQGTQPTTDYTNWGTNVASGGVSFAYHNLNGFEFNDTIRLRDIITVLTNPDGTYDTCFRIEVVIRVDKYCGFTNVPRHYQNSPKGCDFAYQALYPADDSYFHVALNDFDLPIEVNNETLYFKGYCLDPTRSVYPNFGYNGILYSSYDPQVLNSLPNEFVEAPQNFPYVNYLINHEQEYLSRFLSGHQCSWQDVQNAVWRILFPQATTSNPDLLNILNNTSPECVQWIVDDAYAHGANYTPRCPGGKYLLILFPILPGCNPNCTKDYNTQLVAFPTGGACLNKCAPKVCPEIVRGGRKICLKGKCAPMPSTSPSITSKPTLPSTSPSASGTPAASYSSCPSQSSAPSDSSAPSVSRTPASSQSSCPSQSSAPSDSSAPSVSRTPARSQSSCPSKSSTPSESRAPSASRTSRPVLPSDTPSKSAPCHNMPSKSPSKSAPCHNMPSASPSKSAPCHNMPSKSPSKSAPCHNMPSKSPSKSAPCRKPSPSPDCDDKDGKDGKGRPGGHTWGRDEVAQEKTV